MDGERDAVISLLLLLLSAVSFCVACPWVLMVEAWHWQGQGKDEGFESPQDYCRVAFLSPEHRVLWHVSGR